MTAKQRPPVILIHGMWGQPIVWERWQRALESAGYGCLAIRLPGHRPNPDAGMRETLGRIRLRDYVDTARAVVDSLPESPIVIGHSMGGLIAQMLAAEADLAAVVLVSSAPPPGIFPLRPVNVVGLSRHFVRPYLWRKPFRLSLAEADFLLLNAIPAEDRGNLYETLVFESGRVAYEIAFGALRPSLRRALPKQTARCPMLAIAGQRDRIVPVSVSRKMAKWYRGSLTYWEYPEHAHWPLQEPGWERIMERLLQWLEGIRSEPQVPVSSN